MNRLLFFTVIFISICNIFQTSSLTLVNRGQADSSKGQNLQARRMALSIVKELEKHSAAEDEDDLRSEANAAQILQEVNDEYENIAKKINELNRDKRRLRRMQREMKRKRRLEILRNLRRYYRH